MNNTIKINVSAVYSNGISLFNEREMVADPMIFSGRTNPEIKTVVLRIATQLKVADQLLSALQTGKVSLNIESVSLE